MQLKMPRRTSLYRMRHFAMRNGAFRVLIRAVSGDETAHIAGRNGTYRNTLAVRLLGKAIGIAVFNIKKLKRNQPSDRRIPISWLVVGFPNAFNLLPAGCLPLCLDAARYALDKDGGQSARQQNEIVPDSNNRYGLNDFGGVSCVIAAEKTRQKSLSPEWSERPELTVTQTSVSRLSGIAKPSSARGSAYT